MPKYNKEISQSKPNLASACQKPADNEGGESDSDSKSNRKSLQIRLAV